MSTERDDLTREELEKELFGEVIQDVPLVLKVLAVDMDRAEEVAQLMVDRVFNPYILIGVEKGVFADVNWAPLEVQVKYKKGEEDGG